MNLLFAQAPGADFLDYLSRASIVTFLILVVYGGYKGWWVFGWYYRDSEKRCDSLKDDFFKMENEKNAWRDTALKGANIATQAFDEIKRASERD